MQKWEYRTLTNSGINPGTRTCVVRIDGTLQQTHTCDFSEVLNEMGQEGWEAVAAYQDDDSLNYLLKRPLD